MAKHLAMPAVPAAADAGRHLEGRHCGHGECPRHGIVESGTYRRRIGKNTGRDQAARGVVGLEHLADIGGEVVKRRRHPARAFLGPVAKPDHPFAAMPDVVGGFLHRLAGMRRKLPVGRAGHRLPERVHVGGEKELTKDRVREIAVRPFGHHHMPERGAVAKEGVIILALPAALDLGRVAIAHAGRADQVKRHVRQRQILFQHRRMAAPFAQPVAEDQMVVTDSKKQRQKVVPIRHHICPTSSGMS